MSDLVQAITDLRDLLAAKDAERVAKMSPIERLVYEHAMAEYTRRIEAWWMYGDGFS